MRYLTAMAIAMCAVLAYAQKPMTTSLTSGQNPKTKADWQRMYSEAAKLMEKKDAKSLFSVMTPDFTMTMMGKTSGREESQKGMEQWFGMMKNIRASMTVTKVVVKGDTATITDRYRTSGTTLPDPKTKKSGKLVDAGVETATWTRVNGQWMMKKLAMVTQKMTMNGKPFNPNTMGGN